MKPQAWALLGLGVIVVVLVLMQKSGGNSGFTLPQPFMMPTGGGVAIPSLGSVISTVTNNLPQWKASTYGSVSRSANIPSNSTQIPPYYLP